MKTFSIIALVLVAAPSFAVAQTAEKPAATAAAQPLTADEVKAIRKRLQQIEQEIEKEVVETQYNRAGSSRPADSLTLYNSDTYNPRRRPKLPHDIRIVSPYHEQLVRERTALEAKLTAGRIR
jgi:hypothetical protein